VTLTQLALSNSGRMIFVGTQYGTVRSLRYPFGENYDFQEHQSHSKAVTQLKVSYDDQFLFSGSEDGCLYMFRLIDKEDRGGKKDKTTVYADEVIHI
jgi:WD40 repeat protein